MAMQNAENKNMDALSTHSGDKSAQFARLLADIKGIISEDRSAAYAGINAIQIDHNWRIGHRIVVDEQGGKVRAEYGKRTITELSAHLCAEFGDGYRSEICEISALYTLFSRIGRFGTRVCQISVGRISDSRISDYLNMKDYEDNAWMLAARFWRDQCSDLYQLDIVADIIQNKLHHKLATIDKMDALTLCTQIIPHFVAEMTARNGRRV